MKKIPHEKGAKAIILDMLEEGGARIASKPGEVALFAKADVTSEGSVQAAMDKTIHTFG